MHHSIHVWPHAVDEQVHRDLAGNLTPAADLSAMLIDDHQVVGLHHALAHQRGRAEYVSVVHADGEIAVGCRHQTVLVQHFAEANNLFAMLFGRLSRRVLPRLPGFRLRLSLPIVSHLPAAAKPDGRLPDGNSGIIAAVLVSDFDYHLPEELIAKQPLVDRAAGAHAASAARQPEAGRPQLSRVP